MRKKVEPEVSVSGAGFSGGGSVKTGHVAGDKCGKGEAAGGK